MLIQMDLQLKVGLFQGAARGDVSKMADAMLEGLADFVQQGKSSSLKTVKFSIFEAAMLQTFLDAADGISLSKPKEDKGNCGNTVLSYCLFKGCEGKGRNDRSWKYMYLGTAVQSSYSSV